MFYILCQANLIVLDLSRCVPTEPIQQNLLHAGLLKIIWSGLEASELRLAAKGVVSQQTDKESSRNVLILLPDFRKLQT